MTTLYFIFGCTASGKGSVGREIARRVGGQIVSVDSMKVYRRMDIGTAKPSAEQRAAVPHWCIDIVEPSEHFSVAEYVQHADEAIRQIRAAGDVPLAVGGTNLYVKALSEGLFSGPSADPEIRAELRQVARNEGRPALHAMLVEVDPSAADRIHPNDEKRLIRALEVYRSTGMPISELQKQWDQQGTRYDCVYLGLRHPKGQQNRRINARVKKMVEAGLVEEVRALYETPGWLEAPSSQAVGYAELVEHFEGTCSLEEAIERIKINTRRLAKSQRTWQRRFENVRWFEVPTGAGAEEMTDAILAEVDFAKGAGDAGQ